MKNIITFIHENNEYKIKMDEYISELNKLEDFKKANDYFADYFKYTKEDAEEEDEEPAYNSKLVDKQREAYKKYLNAKKELDKKFPKEKEWLDSYVNKNVLKNKTSLANFYSREEEED